MEHPIDSAEAWQARLHSPECTSADRAAYARWQHDHPEAAAACQQAERIYALSGALSRDPWLVMAARSAHRQTARSRRRRVPRLAWAASVAVFALVVGGFLWQGLGTSPVEAEHYATAVGEQRTLQLTDGTTLVLDTNSAVSVRYEDGRRTVALDRGRVQFEVAPDPARPFVVHAGDGVIRDIGTSFQVRRNGESEVMVTLLEGEVRVSLPAANASRTLVPGEQISYTGDRFGATQTINLAAARGWPNGEMVFRGRQLASLVAEMNRYSTRQLQLGAPSLRQLRISGVFHAGDQASLVQALRLGWGLRARQVSPNLIVLEPPAPH